MQRHGSADGGVSHPADHLRDTPLGDAVQLTGRVRTLDPIVALFCDVLRKSVRLVHG